MERQRTKFSTAFTSVSVEKPNHRSKWFLIHDPTLRFLKIDQQKLPPRCWDSHHLAVEPLREEFKSKAIGGNLNPSASHLFNPSASILSPAVNPTSSLTQCQDTSGRASQDDEELKALKIATEWINSSTRLSKLQTAMHLPTRHPVYSVTSKLHHRTLLPILASTFTHLGRKKNKK